MNNDTYTQGFVDKCAEQGVDPKQLRKSADGDPSRLGAGAATVGGGIFGAGAGGLTGTALFSLLMRKLMQSKGNPKQLLGAGFGAAMLPGAGAFLGGAGGAGEGAYQYAKHKQNEGSLKHKLMSLLGR